MPFIASRKGNEAMAKLTGWEIYYIWETCRRIENVSTAERPMCRSGHQQSRSVCSAQLHTMPISSVLQHSSDSFGAKIMLDYLQK